MKKLTKYLLICFFTLIVTATHWSCSKTDNDAEKSISTEMEGENISPSLKEEETVPSDEEYGKDEGFEKDESGDQELEQSDEETPESSGSEEL